MMTKEIWKDVPNYEGYYQVSNLGRVRSLDRITKTTKRQMALKGRILKHCKNHQGYHHVSLMINGRLKTRQVHQLVAIAFMNHKPCGHKIVVDHIDNDINNNRLNNLQLLTNRQNITKEPRGKSKYVGVSWHKGNNKWRTQIIIDGHMKHLGYFNSESDASIAYQYEVNELRVNK